MGSTLRCVQGEEASDDALGGVIGPGLANDGPGRPTGLDAGRGTREVIRLATSERTKVVNYVSTTFVFGWSSRDTLFERDHNRDLKLLDFGYSQTKWAAEQVVLAAIAQGLPARVFRPALITPSVSGAGGNFDIAMRLLAFMLKHGLTTTAGNQVSFVPAGRRGRQHRRDLKPA